MMRPIASPPPPPPSTNASTPPEADDAPLDLNLLRVLRSVYATRHVSRAGDELGMTQSAVSNALRRLRQRLGDELFIRSAQGMLPTARVEALIGGVNSGLAQIDAALAAPPAFDPARSTRSLRLLGNDLAQMVFLPRLLAHFDAVAPGIRLETVDAPVDEARRLLQDGRVDLALGNWPPLGEDFHRQRLFSETLVVLMSRQHPLWGRELSREDYLREAHVDYRPSGATYSHLQTLLDRALDQEGLKREVRVIAGHALGLASIIGSSRLLLTLPGRLAQALSAGRDALGIAALPFPSPAFTISQQWHTRAHRDPGLVWLRRQVVTLLGED
ncbi:MAG TPA: LysR family transcriptional regulator [Burkholderiaceae bacterium]|nr:LysR family transcriptional regulator [Burkholderiaceae bacterium]